MKTKMGLLLMILVLVFGESAAAAPRYSLFYYGNWGGAGWSNGAKGGDVKGSVAPVDDLDAACRTHDRAYASADTKYRREWKDTSFLNVVKRRSILKAWQDAYAWANVELVVAAGRLPALKVNADGTDNWHGKSVGATVKQRSRWRDNVARAYGAHIFKTPRP